MMCWAYWRDGVVDVWGVVPASCVVLVLVFLGGGVYVCVIGLLVGAVGAVEGREREGGVMEGGMREVPLCCPCCHGGRGRPFRLYGVPLVVLAVVDEEVWGFQFVHLNGVGVVAGDGGLGGVVLAGLWDDVVGCPLVAGGLPCE